MKIPLVLILFILCCSLPNYGLTGKCPEGKYYDAQSRRCVTPGEDPTGKTERNFARQLIEEGQAFCVDGWCCPNERAYRKCLQSKNMGKCLKRQGCLVYGE